MTMWGKLAHDFLGFAFMAGIALMFVLWVAHNIPNRHDLVWLAKGGGMFGGGHPPSRKFNAGQKLIFWAVCLGGLSLSLSGLQLIFPFTFHFFNDTFAAAEPAGPRPADRPHADAGAAAGRALARLDGRAPDRGDDRARLHRHGRHGRCVRGDGHRARSTSTGRASITTSGSRSWSARARCGCPPNEPAVRAGSVIRARLRSERLRRRDPAGCRAGGAAAPAGRRPCSGMAARCAASRSARTAARRSRRGSTTA